MKRIFKPTALATLLIFLASLLSACSPVTPVPGDTVPSLTTRTETGPGRTTAASETTQGQSTAPSETKGSTQSGLAAISVTEEGRYTSKMEVAAYLYRFGQLPSNYITKDEARDLGWVASKGNLWDVTDEMSIGGDRFGNFEGLLPDKKGRQYYECDIDYEGGRRGAKRIVFSNDGLIFYTDNHYESFERLE